MNNSRPVHFRHEEWFRRALLFIALYSSVGWLVLSPPFLSDSDLWWHLRIGQWIVDHHAVPYANWFSNYGMGRPWQAYSWLFEVLIYGLYNWFGLMGILFFVYSMAVLITAATYRLVQRFEQPIPISIALTALAMFSMAPLLTPRPWLFTVLLFIIEFDILLSVRRSRNYLRLVLLLPLFALWANIHIQFVYGLFVVGLVACEEPLNQLFRRAKLKTDPEKSLPPFLMLLTLAGCLIATLVNPYHVKIYAILLDILRQGGLYQILLELKAMEFRTMPDFVVLVITLLAAFVLGRQQSVKPFWTLLFLASAILSFRSRRDIWFIAIVAVALISYSTSVIVSAERYILSTGQKLFVIATVALLLVLTVRVNHVSEDTIEAGLTAVYPVAAASVVEQRNYPGPLYNAYDWGGYLMWRLPHLLVAIDGRNQVHDVDRLRRSAAVWNGAPNWEADPELSASRLVIADRRLPLSQLLRLDSRFVLVYEDATTTVFIARPQ